MTVLIAKRPELILPDDLGSRGSPQPCYPGVTCRLSHWFRNHAQPSDPEFHDVEGLSVAFSGAPHSLP